MDATGKSSVCSLAHIPKYNETFRHNMEGNNYALVLGAAAPCRHKDVTCETFCTADGGISNSLATVRTDFVGLLVMSRTLASWPYLGKLAVPWQVGRTLSKLASVTDKQPDPCLWRTLPVSINGVYQIRIVSRDGDSLPYCLKFSLHLDIGLCLYEPGYTLSVHILRQICVIWKKKAL
ncbi:hypothetical protein AVEN_82534-1 [Araneus ventricosus]|uniref:Uncharacterized protein n=1 Tax=Araneus ventricosus TaxID=182803 RepID=A0A4Y2GQF1_ARAVE|nr:hypothetical protein AVEN_82534-1 [Araneus ventricosus]